jgi:hypothetical protein
MTSAKGAQGPQWALKAHNGHTKKRVQAQNQAI